MKILLGLAGIIVSFIMLIFREAIGDTIGDADWMGPIGGVYYVIIYAAVLLFLWSLINMFGLTEHALEPLLKPIMPWIFEDAQEAPMMGF